jgi:hypothetical protein
MNRLACSLAFVIAVVATPAAAERLEDLGLELTQYSRRLEEPHRFVSGRDWDGTVKHFRDRFKGNKSVRWSREVSLPTVKYVHLENLADTGAWQGVNIYQLKNGEVRVYILPRAATKAPAPKP